MQLVVSPAATSFLHSQGDWLYVWPTRNRLRWWPFPRNRDRTAARPRLPCDREHGRHQPLSPNSSPRAPRRARHRPSTLATAHPGLLERLHLRRLVGAPKGSRVSARRIWSFDQEALFCQRARRPVLLSDQDRSGERTVSVVWSRLGLLSGWCRCSLLVTR